MNFTIDLPKFREKKKKKKKSKVDRLIDQLDTDPELSTPEMISREISKDIMKETDEIIINMLSALSKGK